MREFGEDARDHLLALNQTFARRCVYHSIQRAVFEAQNNDFIVVMPGVYTEPHSRQQPTNDPRCQKYLTDTDFGGGGPIGLSYRYQWNCPNDQALVNVLGRRPAAGAPPPPQADRHGIPDLGPCVRCNLQIQGSGAKPEDVVIDSGRVSAGNGGPSGAGSKKDVAKARPVLACYSRAVHHLGELGSGEIAKTINNMLHWAHCIANYEAILLGKVYGLDGQKLRETLVQCPATNGTLARWDGTRFTWQEKDMDIALDLAQKRKLPLPFFGQVDQMIKWFHADDVAALLYKKEAPYMGKKYSGKPIAKS